MFALITAIPAAWGTTPVRAQEISASINTTQALMGETLIVQVQVKNPKQASAPEAPKTDDFEIQMSGAGPQQSSSTYIINNKRWTDVTYTYTFTARPKRAGRLVLPPFRFREGGAVFATEPITVQVSRHIGGELLLAEVQSRLTRAYVGQPVDLTLEVWVKQYERDGFRLDVSDMWTLLMRNQQLNSLGVFEKVATPKWKPGQRTDEAGKTHEYFVYLLETTVYPERPGPFDFGSIALGMNYPITLRRDVFGRISIDRDRVVQVTAKTPSLEILPVPTQGRPADFNGAIGRFTVTATAKPTEVAVGDPITLTLAIRGSGTPLERLSAPKLANVSELTKDFDVPLESPAGEVEGDRKLFSVTLRPLREDVTQIPSLPLSYFDPDTEKFATARTKALPIRVKPAEKLALPTQLGSPGDARPMIAQPTEATEGLIANFTNPADVLVNQSLSVGPAGWSLLTACPLAYVAAWLATRRLRRLASDDKVRRSSQAYGTAKRRLASGANDDPASLRTALSAYIADKFRSDGTGLTRAEAVALLRARGVKDELVSEVDRLLEALETAEYGGGLAAQDAKDIGPMRVRAIIDTLETVRVR
ncbi:MAG: hypothetical protein HBSAPP02_16230 [Phycisphaerae bacterium]|nr:MAG: hypothetical protein HBSAPP02_16230 [Phycisphaerae bacterium]